MVAGERIDLHIEERLRDEPREPTPAELAREKREYGYQAPRKIEVPTGNLRVVRVDTYRKYGAMPRSLGMTAGTRALKIEFPTFWWDCMSLRDRSRRDALRMDVESLSTRRPSVVARN